MPHTSETIVPASEPVVPPPPPKRRKTFAAALEFRRDKLYELKQQVFSPECTACPRLVASRRRIVWGDGDPLSGIVFVGEAPGHKGADVTGVPFSLDRSGEYFNGIIHRAGYRRTDVYVCNAVMCCPPNNDTPTLEEIEHCNHYLQAMLRAIQPRVVVPLGNTALKAILHKEKVSVTAFYMRRMWDNVNKWAIYPAFHPAFILRSMNKPANTVIRTAETIPIQDRYERDIAELVKKYAKRHMYAKLDEFSTPLTPEVPL